jgi:predicted nucleic acid-binding protein
MMAYALDTNTIIRLLRGDPAVGKRFDHAALNHNPIIIPPYVNFEMMRGFHYRPAVSKERSYKELCVRYPVGEMTLEMWELAATCYGEMRRAGQTMDDADSLIAAFCVTGNHTLVTNNTKHFVHVENLQLADWTE